jgi:hypothetical protein
MRVSVVFWDRRLLMAFTLLAALASPAAASRRDELLRYVPADVGFCLVLQDLRAHALALAESPFIEQLRRSSLGQALGGAQEWTKLDAVEAKLKKDLGVDWTRLRDDFLGEAVVFAFKPSPSGRNDQEEGVILVRARTANALNELVGRINKVQRDKGELKRDIEERVHRGVRYYCREEAHGTNFYCLRGPVLIFSGEEAMLRRAIEQGLAKGDDPPPLARRLDEAGAGKAVIALWVNPRALDSQIESGTDRNKEVGEETARQTFLACWKALDDVVLSVELERDLALSLAIRGRLDHMPAGVRRFLAASARPSELWRSFPENALFAMGLRIDVAALFDAIGDFLPKETRQSFRRDLERTLGAALGMDLFKDFVPALGPDGGVCVLAPPAAAKDWFPRVVLALRVAGGGRPALLEPTLLKALDVGASLAVLAYNRANEDKTLKWDRATVDEREVKYLVADGGLPGGLQPTFTLRDGYLVVASSLEALRAFRPAEGPAVDSGTTPLLRISFKDWRMYLRQRREELAETMAKRDGMDKEEALHRLDSLADGLEFLDRLELRQRTAPGLVVFTLSLQPAQPLRK